MTAFDYVSTAKMPFGIILKEIVALEARGLGGVPALALDDAVTIQRDLIALELIRVDVETGGPLAAIVREDKTAKIKEMPLPRMIAPPGRALERFSREYLTDSEIDLSDVIKRATAMQDSNTVPQRVPPIGTIYCSAQTGLGKGGGALINHFGLTGALMIQCCCRCMLLPQDRAMFPPVRINNLDPQPLQEAQTLLNKLIEEKRHLSFIEGDRIGRYTAVGIGWLFESGFGAYAFTVKDFMDDPHAPFRSGTLKNWAGTPTSI